MTTRRFRPLCSGAIPVLVAVLVLAVYTPTFAATTAGPKAYYLALGDSLAYGYQPDGDVVQGYADDFYTDLQTHGLLRPLSEPMREQSRGSLAPPDVQLSHCQ